MISYEFGVEDLADTRFALSPVYETVLSLRLVREPALHALHRGWRESIVDKLSAVDAALLVSLVGRTGACRIS